MPEQKSKQEQKQTDLTIMAITHGNEVAGLAVLAAWLDLLATKCIELECRVALILGNLPAARQDKRFLEGDLNRSFGRDTSPLQNIDVQKILCRIWPILHFSWIFTKHHRPAYILFLSSPFEKKR